MISLVLGYRTPFAWNHLVSFLAARAIPGVEAVAGGAYRRTVRIGARVGWLSVTDDPERAALRVVLAPSLACLQREQDELVARLRTLFDLDARPDVIAALLEQDTRLAPLVSARPGLRVPGAMDGFEMTMRAILGQQVSVRGATTLSGRLAAAHGEAIATPFADLTRITPRATALANAGAAAIATIGLPLARARALAALAEATAHGGLAIAPSDDPSVRAIARARLLALPGIGAWTADYVAMRALRDPDAFPAGDLVLRRALDTIAPRAAEARAAAWRPWRAYAAMHLWAGAAAGAASRR